MSKRRPHRRRDPNLRRIRSVAFIIAIQALRRAQKQIPNMPLPQGVNKTDVGREFAKLIVGLQGRLNRMTGAPKDSIVT